MTTAILHPVSGDRPAGPSRTVRPGFVRHLHDEIVLLTLVATVGYLASAFYTRFSLHFSINDALNRTGDALFVTVGRDPHLGAIGFYWPPLPQLLQLPFMPFLRPFGEEILAGPISSALCMAATIPVVAAIGRVMGRGRWTIFVVCLVFAVTPYTVYTASNGMSEGCFELSIAITLLGFLGYVKTESTRDILILGFGLAAATMTRPEGPFLVVAIVAVAALRLQDLRRSLWHVLLLAAPAFGCYVFWLIVQFVLLGDPIFYIHQNTGQANPNLTGKVVWLPQGIYGNLPKVIEWEAGWVMVFAPLMFLLLPLLLSNRLRPRRATLGIIFAMGALLGVQFLSVGFQHGFGDPRYFGTGILFGAIAALWVSADLWEVGPGSLGGHRRRLGGPGGKRAAALTWNVALTASLVVTAGYSSWSLTSGRLTHVENECVYFQYGVARAIPFLGRPQHGLYACLDTDNVAPWNRLDRWIDRHLTARDRVLADNSSNYAATLFTTRPGLFIVRNDRDWSKTIADPRSVTYIATQSRTESGFPDAVASLGSDEGITLIKYDPVGWHLVRSYPGAFDILHRRTFVQLWHYIPHPGAPTPAGTESNLR